MQWLSCSALARPMVQMKARPLIARVQFVVVVKSVNNIRTCPTLLVQNHTTLLQVNRMVWPRTVMNGRAWWNLVKAPLSRLLVSRNLLATCPVTQKLPSPSTLVHLSLVGNFAGICPSPPLLIRLNFPVPWTVVVTLVLPLATLLCMSCSMIGLG